ncbi:MAG: ATP-binding protein [Spirochaetales bacterium]|nr:ATP-binding protein [Spirochaetales bacterium]
MEFNLADAPSRVEAQRPSENLPRDFLLSIIDAVSDYILVIDQALQVVLANGAVDTFFALATERQEPLKNQKITEIPMLRDPQILKAVKGVFQTGEAHLLRHSWDINTRPTHFSITVQPFYVASQVVYGMLILRNITSEENERRLIREQNRHMGEEIHKRTVQLRKANMNLAIFKRMIDQARYGSVILDMSRRIVYANDYTARIHGTQLPQLLGAGIDELHPEDQREILSQYLDEVMERGSAPSCELDHLYRGGIRFPMLCTASTVRDPHDEPKYFAMAFQDMSAQRDARQALERAKGAAEETARAKSAFLANMSHEIRTPLNAVIGFAELIAETEMNGFQEEYIHKISSSAKTLLALINDILDFSKIEAGKMDLITEPFDLQEVMKDVMGLFSSKVKEKGVELSLLSHHSVPHRIIFDEMRLRQVVMNLVSNAVKFTEKGSISVSLSYEPEEGDGEQRFGQLVLVVTDSGQGIKEEHQKRIFEAFEQTGELDNRSLGGTGLGLSIVAKIVQLFQGTINVESQYGEGAQFTVSLPHIESVTNPQRNEESFSSAPLMFRGQSVLVVDDDELNRSLVRNFFQNSGIIIREASSGGEALEMVEGNPPDLILMDLLMDPVSGYEAITKLRSHPQFCSIPVIAVTAVRDDEGIPGLDESGFDEVIHKPVTREVLESALSRHLLADSEISSSVVIFDDEPSEENQMELKNEDVECVLQNPRLQKLWNQARSGESLMDVQAFVDELEELDLEGLAEFQSQLKRSVASFDIMGIRRLIQLFEANTSKGHVPLTEENTP